MWREVEKLGEVALENDRWYFGKSFIRWFLNDEKPDALLSVHFDGMWHGPWDHCESCESGTLGLLRTTVMSLHTGGAPLGEEYWIRDIRTVLPVKVTKENVESEALRRAETFTPNYITWNGEQY